MFTPENPMNELIDIGVNLAHRRFEVDREAVIARAQAAGVRQMVITGTSLGSSRQALNLARGRPDVLSSTAGIHPHDAKNATAAALSEIRELAMASEVRAIGECGLDFDRDFSPRPAQEAAFEAQLEMAASLGKPVFLHERAAHERFVAIIHRWRPRLRGAVLHCFTGTASELDAYLALDIHIGITGWINDERRGLGLREVVARIPADRLMIETDAPFLTPRDARPLPRDRRNEPSLLTYVLAAVARAIGKPEAQVALETTRTAREFFGITVPSP
jgi:TatD DNase family protein